MHGYALAYAELAISVHRDEERHRFRFRAAGFRLQDKFTINKNVFSLPNAIPLKLRTFRHDEGVVAHRGSL